MKLINERITKLIERKYTIDINIVNQCKRIIFSKQFKSVKNKEGYHILFKSNNKYLFSKLAAVKMFDFYSTNSGEIVSLHQIVAYLFKGYKAFKNGYTIDKNIHVHHIDSNTSNNTPGNLVYVSSQEHLLITQATTMCCDHIKVFNGDCCPFNCKGEEVNNFFHRLTHLVKATLERTLKSFGCNFKIKSHKIFKSIPHYLGFKRFNWCPDFVHDVVVSIQQKMWQDICPSLSLTF